MANNTTDVPRPFSCRAFVRLFAAIRAVMPPVAFPRSVRLVARPGRAPRSCVPCRASCGRPASGSSSANVRPTREGAQPSQPFAVLRPALHLAGYAALAPCRVPPVGRHVARLGCAPHSCAARGASCAPSGFRLIEQPAASISRQPVKVSQPSAASGSTAPPDVLRPWAIRPDLRRTSGPWCVPSANRPPQGATVRPSPSTFAAFRPVRAGLPPPLRRAASAPSVRLVGRLPRLALLCRLWRVPQSDVSSNPPRPISRQPCAVRLIERERPRRSRPEVPRRRTCCAPGQFVTISGERPRLSPSNVRNRARFRPNVPPVVRLPVPLPDLAATVRPSPSTFAAIRAIMPPVGFMRSIRLVARPVRAPRSCVPCRASRGVSGFRLIEQPAAPFRVSSADLLRMYRAPGQFVPISGKPFGQPVKVRNRSPCLGKRAAGRAAPLGDSSGLSRPNLRR